MWAKYSRVRDDGKNHKVEEMLPKILAKLEIYSQLKKKSRKKEIVFGTSKPLKQN
jgi:hypothetical protein